MSTLTMDFDERSYDITVSRGAIKHASELFALDRRVLVVTDDGVPAQYSKAIADAAGEPHILTIRHGEASKCPERYLEILKFMLACGFDRHDCVVAVGGGVVGDLAGFAAATYMRGIDLYNIPTTLLSQVDSSVGGKTAIDFLGYKNVVGAFWQPKGVIVDPDVLESLDARQFACGMSEIIKMFATSDGKMFGRLEDKTQCIPVEEIITAALRIKMNVVEQDEHEAGLRRVLNFGHTIGHAIESISADEPYPLLHGECVALGMLAITEGEVRRRLMHLLHRYDLPTAFRCDESRFREVLLHDKKAQSGDITVVLVDEIGSFSLKTETVDSIIARIKGVISFS
ncbi:3-dehydroquinate synthase [Ruminococcus sp. CAG:382]|nr:3-dehydroquinate synthase [Ruminococcus sp. CAG:382]